MSTFNYDDPGLPVLVADALATYGQLLGLMGQIQDKTNIPCGSYATPGLNEESPILERLSLMWDTECDEVRRNDLVAAFQEFDEFDGN